MKMTIILGNQLFDIKYFDPDTSIFMCEDYALCTHFMYHKHKIIFFLASMRNFRDKLLENDFTVNYFKINKKEESFFKNLLAVCKENRIKTLAMFEIEDKFFEIKIVDFCQKHKIELEVKETPMFLSTRCAFQEYLKTTKKPFMKTFYESMRKRTGILMNKNYPVGGKFSFDEENRKKIPKKHQIIKTPIQKDHDKNTLEVMQLVDKMFSKHPGKVDNFWMHTTAAGANKELKFFLEEKFENFGAYEDAIDTREPFLYHSVLSPYINIGLLTPKQVLKEALSTEAPLNSKEGFIRQVLGWREFIRGIYQEYSKEYDDANFFNHKRKLTNSWYEGTTGIIPLDDAIKKAINFGYCHHIERLMIISNIMLLCEIQPNEVYKWFMEMFVDSSDWVMAPNVYGMAQFSEGGIFATKPYIAGSNYIRKMSHYKNDKDSDSPWNDILDGLYWRFIDKNSDFFSRNYRMKMMVSLLKKMDTEKKEYLFELAENFIATQTTKN